MTTPGRGVGRMTNIDDPRYALETQQEAGRARRRPPKAAVAWTVGILAAVGIIVGVMVNVGTDIVEVKYTVADLQAAGFETNGAADVQRSFEGFFTVAEGRLDGGELTVYLFAEFIERSVVTDATASGAKAWSDGNLAVVCQEQSVCDQFWSAIGAVIGSEVSPEPI